MKLKGAAKKMSPAVPVLLTLVPGIALVLLRVYQSLSLLDPATGFFTDKSNFTVPLFYILAVGTPVLSALVSYLCPLSKAEGIPAGKNLLHGFGALFLAGAVLMDSINVFFDRQASSNPKLALVCAVLGALAAASLICVDTAYFTGGAFLKKLRLLHLALPLWGLAKTASYFSINAPYLRNSALLLCIFGDVFLMIFLFEYARKISFLAGDGNSPSFLTSGLSAAVLQLAAAVTGVIGMLPGRAPFLHAEFALYRVAAAVFCVTAVALFFKLKAPDYVPGQEEAGSEIETFPLATGTEDEAEAAPEASPEEPEHDA